MREMSISNLEALSKMVVKDARQNKFVTVTALYEEAIELVKYILCEKDTYAELLELEAPDHNGYVREFYITVDESLGVWVEKAWSEANVWHEAGYMKHDPDVMYVVDNCNHKIISAVEDNCEIFCVSVRDEPVSEPIDLLDAFDILFGIIKNVLEPDEDKVLKFIKERFPDKANWDGGNCYYFAKLLQERFKEGQVYYDVIDGHFVFGLDDKYYDHSGIVEYDNTHGENHYLVNWDTFDSYDPIQKKRIIRDCIH